MPNDGSDPGPRPLTEAQQWVGAVCDVTGWNVKLMAGRAAKLGKLLREAGGTVAELTAHFGQADTGAAWWYYRDDWRGKRGDRPSQAAIMERWGAWELPVAVLPAVAEPKGYAAIREYMAQEGLTFNGTTD